MPPTNRVHLRLPPIRITWNPLDDKYNRIKANAVQLTDPLTDRSGGTFQRGLDVPFQAVLTPHVGLPYIPQGSVSRVEQAVY